MKINWFKINSNSTNFNKHLEFSLFGNKIGFISFINYLLLGEQKCFDCEFSFIMCNCNYCFKCHSKRCICNIENIEDFIVNWIIKNLHKEKIKIVISNAYEFINSHDFDTFKHVLIPLAVLENAIK